MRMFCIVCEGRAELKLRKWLEICLARTLCREVGLSAPPPPCQFVRHRAALEASGTGTCLRLHVHECRR